MCPMGLCKSVNICIFWNIYNALLELRVIFLAAQIIEIVLIFLFSIWAASMNLLDKVIIADMKGKLNTVKVEALSFCKFCTSTASATSKHCG